MSLLVVQNWYCVPHNISSVGGAPASAPFDFSVPTTWGWLLERQGRDAFRWPVRVTPHSHRLEE